MFVATGACHAPDMTTSTPARHTKPLPRIGSIVEEWWCPVCDRAAHRVYRPGRPRIYCSNACRQRAYRYRRSNKMRSIARPQAPLESATYPFGRRHALRAKGDFMWNLSDQRRRRVTVCGVLAKPSRHFKLRHFDFIPDAPGSCRACVQLVTPPGEDPPTPVLRNWSVLSTMRHTYVPGSPASFDE